MPPATASSRRFPEATSRTRVTSPQRLAAPRSGRASSGTAFYDDGTTEDTAPQTVLTALASALPLDAEPPAEPQPMRRLTKPMPHPAAYDLDGATATTARATRRSKRRGHRPLALSWRSLFWMTLLFGQLVLLLELHGRALSAAHQAAALDVQIANVRDDMARTQDAIAAFDASPRISEWARERGWAPATQDKLDDITNRAPMPVVPQSAQGAGTQSTVTASKASKTAPARRGVHADGFHATVAHATSAHAARVKIQVQPHDVSLPMASSDSTDASQDMSHATDDAASPGATADGMTVTASASPRDLNHVENRSERALGERIRREHGADKPN